MLTNPLCLICNNLNISLLALNTAGWLVNHNHRVRERKTLTLCTRCKKNGAHRRCHTNADSRNIRLDKVHGIKDAQTCINVSTRRVNVERNILVWVLALKVQKLCNNKICRITSYRFSQENNTIIEQSGVDVIATLTTRSLLNNIRNSWNVCWIMHNPPSKVFP